MDPISNAMFRTDDLKVSPNEIESKCLVPQKSPNFESEINDSYDDIIETYADKDEGEEIFIQESIIIENSKTFDKKNNTKNETNNGNEIIFDMSDEDINAEGTGP